MTMTVEPTQFISNPTLDDIRRMQACADESLAALHEAESVASHLRFESDRRTRRLESMTYRYQHPTEATT